MWWLTGTEVMANPRFVKQLQLAKCKNFAVLAKSCFYNEIGDRVKADFYRTFGITVESIAIQPPQNFVNELPCFGPFCNYALFGSSFCWRGSPFH